MTPKLAVILTALVNSPSVAAQDTCKAGIYGELVPLLQSYGLAQTSCAQAYPAQCVTPKVKRRREVDSCAVKRQVSKVNAVSSVSSSKAFSLTSKASDLTTEASTSTPTVSSSTPNSFSSASKSPGTSNRPQPAIRPQLASALRLQVHKRLPGQNSWDRVKLSSPRSAPAFKQRYGLYAILS